MPATLREQPEDFRVDELPAYEPSGEGEHLYLRVEKRGLNTRNAIDQIAHKLGLDPRNAGWAGLKDRHATTSQWVSLHAPSPVEIAADTQIGEGLWVREVSRHGNKLRTGHLRGNRFALRLADTDPARDTDVQRVLDTLARRGLPNYFGGQRFGHEGDNLTRALDWLVNGGKAPRSPFLRKLWMSTYQAAIFNRVLDARLRDGTLDAALEGDVLRKEPAGGMFVCEAPDVDGGRVRDWEISPTGPMFGVKMRQAAAAVSETENAALEALGGNADLLARAKRHGEGTRRALRVRPEDVQRERRDDGLWLRFTLPAGSYATVLVRELTNTPLWNTKT